MAMKKLLVPAVMAGLFFSLEAKAQERAGSAAIGAVSGAVVLGPIGAVAGALIGFTAGPAIAHSWGVGRSAPRSRVHYTGQPGAGQEAAARVRRCRSPNPQKRPLRKWRLNQAERPSGLPQKARRQCKDLTDA